MDTTGRVIGLDISAPMLSRARQAVAESGFVNVELRESDPERLPIGDGEIDVAIVNGIFNLNPAREAIFSELARLIKTLLFDEVELPVESRELDPKEP